MKKQLKSGFTLAEVLITMAIIGIVAAIIMPAVITSYQSKSVGVKLAKFASTVENSARAYVVSNDSFKSDEATIINGFINDAFIYKEILQPKNKAAANLKLDNVQYTGLTGSSAKDQTQLAINGVKIENLEDENGKPTSVDNATLIGVMKDNTKVAVIPLSADSDAAKWADKSTTNSKMQLINKAKVGEGAFIILFDPNVTGLPKAVQKTFSYVVTELGYMFPAANDDCLWQIVDEDYSTKSSTFKEGTHCYKK